LALFGVGRGGTDAQEVQDGSEALARGQVDLDVRGALEELVG